MWRYMHNDVGLICIGNDITYIEIYFNTTTTFTDNYDVNMRAVFLKVTDLLM